jgi:DNA-binding CsgD family transcriptional regulator
VKTMRAVSKRELEVIAAWWHAGTVVEAAKILGITEQTAKNQLHTARLRTGAPTTLALARMFSGELPSVATLRRKARKAA